MNAICDTTAKSETLSVDYNLLLVLHKTETVSLL